jgi:hypothetical protein
VLAAGKDAAPQHVYQISRRKWNIVEISDTRTNISWRQVSSGRQIIQHSHNGLFAFAHTKGVESFKVDHIGCNCCVWAAENDLCLRPHSAQSICQPFA